MFFADFCAAKTNHVCHTSKRMAYVSSNMFERLQKKWKVGGLQIILILCTFAIGGSLQVLLVKRLMNCLAIGQDWLWTLIYILVITIIWPWLY